MSLLYEIFILPIEIIYRAIYLGSLQFTHNYGLSILVLSCISAVAFIPLGRLAVGTQAREKKLQMIMAPQLARIRKESKGAERQRRIAGQILQRRCGANRSKSAKWLGTCNYRQRRRNCTGLHVHAVSRFRSRCSNRGIGYSPISIYFQSMEPACPAE